MKTLHLHPWRLTPRRAVELQRRLRESVEFKPFRGKIRHVAGADIALDSQAGVGYAGVVVFRFPEMEEVERRGATARLTFPYIPGLLAFREVPVLLKAFRKLKIAPDLIFCDGQGTAHPRRFGIACHLGLLLDRATLGVAKSRLVGEFRQPADRSGASSELRDRGEVIGAVLRTRPGTRPVFVSPGHRMDFETALEMTLAVCDGYRIPKPTRVADAYVGYLRSAAKA
ncbi:MAG: deoxyribonuclease V [Acidobacteria bacterium]|nr:deoxyribonuclease V [Acidobacteriota bacterium]